jgi:hypothetical protein
MENFAQYNQPNPGRRASDGGLSGLGLLMQLVGGITGALTGGVGLLALIQMLQMGGRGMPGSILLFMLALIVTSFMRSIFHAAAGRRLLYEGPGTPGGALKKYVTISFIQIGVLALGLMANGAPGGIMFALVLLLAAWPITLLIFAKPKIDAFGEHVPMADDKGFEGASILMLIFGIMGTVAGAMMVMSGFDLLKGGGRGGAGMLGFLMFGAFVMLLIRSILHLRAGIRGTNATHMSQTAEAAEKYANFGVIAACVTGGAILIGVIAAMPGGGGGGAIMMYMLFVISMLVWMLLVWPLSIKKFFADRQFATMMETQGNAQQSSTDRGLPALGWLLLGLGVWSVARDLAGLLMPNMGDDGGYRRHRGGNPMEEIFGMLGNSSGKLTWLDLGVAAVQIWAGFCLIKLNAQYKIAGIAYGVAAGALALYMYLPMFGALSGGGVGMIMNPTALLVFGAAAINLVTPIATVVFVQRKITDPKALAQAFE